MSFERDCSSDKITHRLPCIVKTEEQDLCVLVQQT